MPKYCFTGHEAIGAHIARCLEPLGWKRAFDAADAHIAFSYCTTLTALEDAYFDDDGFVRRAKPGTLLVDLSPSTPALARELSAVATVNDLRPVEAPISVVDPTRPDAFAQAANVMCFAAGEEQDVEEAIDVLETIAGRVERTGAPGTAQLAKAARTVQMAALTAGAAEADALVRATHDATALLDSYAASVRPACEEMTGLPAHRLPSTSPANAAWSLDALVEAYAPLFDRPDDQQA